MHRLTKWGNSTGLRLPASVMEAAGLEAGDYVYVRLLDNGDIRVRPAKNVQPVAAIDSSENGADIDAATAPPKETTW